MLIDGEDYYLDEESGNVVFTTTYHLKRGYCCDSGCRHCPWREKKQEKNQEKKC
jgi:hypothetical protein